MVTDITGAETETKDYSTALALLKLSLGVSHTARDELFRPKLEAADKELLGKGITLDMSKSEDIMLLVDYTEWHYRNRDTEKVMPESLKLRINNRKVKGRAKNGT